MIKRSPDSSISGKSDINRFSLPLGSSFCSSPTNQLTKRSEPATRLILPRTSVTESALPSRKAAGNKYGDDGSSTQQMTDKLKCPVSIYLFTVLNRSSRK